MSEILEVASSEIFSWNRRLFSAAALKQIKHVSIAFDIRSQHSILMTGSVYKELDQLGPAQSFDSTSAADRLGRAHYVAKSVLQYERSRLWYAVGQFSSICTIELDMTNAYCAIGCCRQLFFNKDDLDGITIQQMRVVGLRHEAEMKEWQDEWDSWVASESVNGLEKWEVELNPKTDPWEQWKMEKAEEPKTK
jgi:hypothetical protein